MRERLRTFVDDVLRLVGVWALAGASVSATVLAVWSWAEGFSGPIVALMGLAALTLVLVAAAASFFVGARLKKIPTETTATTAPTSVTASMFSFFPNRERLQAERPLLATLQSADELWIWCGVGTSLRISDDVQRARVTRLLLATPDAESVALQLLASAVNRTAANLANDIQLLTREAQQAGVTVRWYAGATGDALIIGDPRTENGWVQVESFVPGVVQRERASFSIERREQPRLFDALVAAFDRAWESNSREAEPQRDARLELSKRVLRESAAYLRTENVSPTNGDAGFGRARVIEFVEQLLAAGELDHFRELQRDFIRKNYNAAQSRDALASYLERLAATLTADMLDPNATPPPTFRDLLVPRR
jgi:hypothetical protein